MPADLAACRERCRAVLCTKPEEGFCFFGEGEGSGFDFGVVFSVLIYSPSLTVCLLGVFQCFAMRRSASRGVSAHLSHYGQARGGRCAPR